VIHEVDEALRRLIRDEALRGSDIDVVLDAPTREWAARRNAPTVNLYLYDLREDLRKRTRGLLNEYDRGRVVARHLPPRHIKLSYLLTAWTQRAEDEHRLLSALLMTFLRHESVPPSLLTGQLAELGLPVGLTVALPPPEDRSFADVWTALGGELKPSLDVVVIAPVDTGAAYATAPPPTSGLVVGLAGDEPVGHTPPADPHPVRADEPVIMRRWSARERRG
jgi:Pvc16 N-terminal domain